LTRDSEPAEFVQAGRLLAGAGVATDAIFGNHDMRHQIDGAPVMAAEGVSVHIEPGFRDLPGLRVVYGHTPTRRDKRGYLPPGHLERLVELAAGAGPAAVVLHHPPQWRTLPTHYPPGLVPDESRRLLTALAAANPDTVVLVGHTHRSRRYRLAGLTISEVGSTKDYPGVWAGYRVYEGGIQQTVRRVADPTCLAWTEATGRALHGVWRRWSPGRLGDRCWTQLWSR
ncbi:MAG: metallophosphoesterase family protein, partial [Acidimicrobiales bacterium]